MPIDYDKYTPLGPYCHHYPDGTRRISEYDFGPDARKDTPYPNPEDEARFRRDYEDQVKREQQQWLDDAPHREAEASQLLSEQNRQRATRRRRKAYGQLQK